MINTCTYGEYRNCFVTPNKSYCDFVEYPSEDYNMDAQPRWKPWQLRYLTDFEPVEYELDVNKLQKNLHEMRERYYGIQPIDDDEFIEDFIMEYYDQEFCKNVDRQRNISGGDGWNINSSQIVNQMKEVCIANKDLRIEQRELKLKELIKDQKIIKKYRIIITGEGWVSDDDGNCYLKQSGERCLSTGETTEGIPWGIFIKDKRWVAEGNRQWFKNPGDRKLKKALNDGTNNRVFTQSIEKGMGTQIKQTTDATIITSPDFDYGVFAGGLAVAGLSTLCFGWWLAAPVIAFCAFSFAGGVGNSSNDNSYTPTYAQRIQWENENKRREEIKAREALKYAYPSREQSIKIFYETYVNQRVSFAVVMFKEYKRTKTVRLGEWSNEDMALKVSPYNGDIEERRKRLYEDVFNRLNPKNSIFMFCDCKYYGVSYTDLGIDSELYPKSWGIKYPNSWDIEYVDEKSIKHHIRNISPAPIPAEYYEYYDLLKKEYRKKGIIIEEE